MEDREESVSEKMKKLVQDIGGRAGEFGCCNSSRDNSSGRDGGHDGGQYGDRDGDGLGSAHYRDNDNDKYDNHDSGRNGGRYSYDDGYGYRDGGRMRDGDRYSHNGDGGYGYCNGGRDNNEPRVAYNCCIELTQKSDLDDEKIGKRSGGGESMDTDRAANNRSIPELVMHDDTNPCVVISNCFTCKTIQNTSTICEPENGTFTMVFNLFLILI